MIGNDQRQIDLFGQRQMGRHRKLLQATDEFGGLVNRGLNQPVGLAAEVEILLERGAVNRRGRRGFQAAANLIEMFGNDRSRGQGDPQRRIDLVGDSRDNLPEVETFSD